MKAAHRHQLETNALAQRLDVAIERFRPYASTIVGVIVAVVVVMLIWSYVSRSTVARQGEAWNSFHQVVTATRPDLDQLRRSAQEFPGSPMAQLADVTWADGQVLSASASFIYNRTASMEALDRATSAYQSVLQTSDEERLLNRAHLGLARVYEIRNELKLAREEYLKVGGGYAEYAKQQVERLDKPQTAEAIAWLAKAEPPRPRAPSGPGKPGEKPEFSEGDIALPGTAQGAESGISAPGTSESFEELIKGLGLEDPPAEGDKRYETLDAASPSTDAETPSDAEPASEPAGEAPTTEKPAE
jgi:hypothetical protein